jgi:hypothetical protein
MNKQETTRLRNLRAKQKAVTLNAMEQKILTRLEEREAKEKTDGSHRLAVETGVGELR